LDVELHVVADEEDVVLVVDVLVPLMGVEGVLDRQRVHAELARESLQVVLRRLVDVDPHHLAVAGQQLGDEIEIVLRPPLPVAGVRTCGDRTHVIGEAIAAWRSRSSPGTSSISASTPWSTRRTAG